MRKNGAARRRRAGAIGIGGAAAISLVLTGCEGGASGADKARDAKPVAVRTTAPPTPTAAKTALDLVDDSASGQGGKQIVVAALANDTLTGTGAEDADVARAVGAGTYALTVSVKPQHGTAVVSGTNLVYTATAGYTGADEFTYQVAGKGAGAVSDTAVVRINVSAPASTPKAPSVPKPRKTAKPPEPTVYYANCSAVRAAGAAPIHRGDPGYARHLDRDGDGVGCESSSGTSGGSGGSSGGSTGGSSGGSSSGGTSGGSSGGGATYYKNCTAVRAAGAAPIHRGDPGYARHLDRDGDGVGCE
ncbi:excalibur calcium-binding domain-containing protein [Streptomyces sp. NPDC004111]|uniref:excalibur calcium-binding domain-containing protein n=1 Tax=Streptomyces sp. NPDC004111 TaxID=3364690 RepID=UPI0036C7B486